MRPSELFEIELPIFLESIFSRYHYDFRHYAKSSMRRRLTLALQQLHFSSLSSLQDRVLRDCELFSVLLQYMTVGTSEMFRDTPYFSALRTEVIPILKTFPSVKVWVAGCSTGEEVYSLSILFKEEGMLDRSLFYATDINQVCLMSAESGTYPLEVVHKAESSYRASGGKAQLSDYYKVNDGRAVFDPSLRKNIIFADHSLTTDHVFSEVHFISCRNVLIYFDRDFQNRALTLFLEALIYQGILGLGIKESLRFSNIADEFKEIAPRAKIYQKCVQHSVMEKRNPDAKPDDLPAYESKSKLSFGR